MPIKMINRHTTKTPSYCSEILKLIQDCRNEPHKDERVKILNQINSTLLKSDQLSMPSQFTNEYLDATLHKIEGSLLLLKGSK
jgi:hypothetical protein